MINVYRINVFTQLLEYLQLYQFSRYIKRYKVK